MRAILITDADYKKLIKEKKNECRKAYKNFTRKKKTHFTDKKLTAFLQYCTDDISPMFYTVPFKCFFSFYLYVYLKKHAERFEFEEGKYQFLFSKPFDVNLSKISRLADVPLNTVKAAFKELVRHEFLLYTETLSESHKNKCKTAMLANEFFVIGYDTLTKKTCFNNRQMKFATTN
ncbi:MAG TPA: hypothetical protein DCY06_06510 [Bacteroidetes bacterium]|nr:hypothetical protein [Bacteroidota bacterium]